MALVKCPECGKEVSTLAESCPNCGYPAEYFPKPDPIPKYAAGSKEDDIRNHAEIKVNERDESKKSPLAGILKAIVIIALLCIIGVVLVLVIGSADSDSTSKDNDTVPASSISEVKVVENSEDNADIETDTVTIEEQVLYDQNDIKITATGLEDGWMGTELKLLIENNSSQGIVVQARNANVNGFMVDTMMSADVAAGKKANDSLTFMTSGLKECGIDGIAEMEFYFHIFESESWSEIVDTDVITVKTSIASSYTQEVDDSGKVLVDSNGVKIVEKGLSANDSFWGPGLILYIENNSDKNVIIQVRDVSVNGYMVESSMSEEIVSGKKAMSAVQFFRTDLEENSITDISDLELYFHIFDQETWDSIFDSEKLSITF